MSVILELTRIVQAAAEADTASAQVSVIVDSIQHYMGLDVCSLYLADERGDMALLASRGLDPAAVGNVRIPAGKGLVGLVTGGASGLGRATVERLAREGARVTLCDLPSSAGAAVAKELGEDRCIFVPVDVTKEADVQEALRATKERFGRLDATVNCAGIGVAYKTYNFNKQLPHKLDDFVKVGWFLVTSCLVLH